MLRAEHCICGTSTTGTGTLTLAVCPQPPGGTDLYQAIQVQGLGTSVDIPVSYTIVEYTGTDFQTVTRQEKGVGLLNLGASITATTLARTTVQQTATGMSTAAATYNTSSPTAISIVTAANVLVFIGASATDLSACSPYFDMTMAASDGLGAFPVNLGGTFTGNITLTSACDHYSLFEWRIPKLVKGVRINLVTASASGTAFGRIYAVGANARPTKLLYSFGTIGSLSLPTGTKASSTGGAGFYLQAGEYFMDVMALSGNNAVIAGYANAYNNGRLGYATGIGMGLMLRAGGASTAAGDPANVGGLDIVSGKQLFFSLV
jgi:hypothetical protein